MITDKTLMTLGGVAAILVIVSAWQGSYEPTVEFEFRQGQLIASDLEPEQIDTVEIQSGEETVTLRRAGDSFRVATLNNYPASNREVNNLVRSVLGIRAEAEVTGDPDAHAELHVLPGSEGATTVRFLDPEGKELIGVVVSDTVEGAQYARLASDDTVFRTEETVSLRTDGMDFVDKQLLELERDQIAKVQVAPSEGKVYVIESPEAGKVELQGIPDGMKVKGTEPDSVLGAATWLNFTDFRSEADSGEFVFDNSYAVTTRGKARYVLEIAKHDEKWWAKARAEYVGPKNITVPELPPDATDEQRKANDELLKQNEAYLEADKAVKVFNDRHQSWVYEIPEWKATSMTKAFDQLVEADDGKPEKITASHILIPYQGAERADAGVTRTKEEAKALAEEILAKVKADPSQFAALAKEHSSCPSSEKGGDLGEFTFEKMSKPFSEAAFALEVDALAPEVVETEFGYHVIQRTK